MTTIISLAREFDIEPHEVAASLDLGRDYDDLAELDETTAAEYREVLTIMAQQRADLA